MSEEKNIQVNFRISETLLKRLDERAKEKGITRTELLKFIILKEIERNDN